MESRLSLFCIEKQSLWLSLVLTMLTAVSVVSKKTALRGINLLLEVLDAPAELLDVSKRDKPLRASPPPGSDEVVMVR